MIRWNRIRDLCLWLMDQTGWARSAVLGAILLGTLGLLGTGCQPATEHLPATQPAASPASTLTSATATETAALSVPSIYGTVFHDWNGNGQQDSLGAPGEPPLPGIRVCLDSRDSGPCAVSAADGQYVIKQVSPGDHTLLLESERFSYVFPSVDGAVALETEGVPVAADGPTLVNLGLGEGPLTLPFLCGEMGQVVGVSDNFDRDPRPGPMRDWMGTSQTRDSYMATTFEARGGLQLVASAPGVVVAIGSYVDGHMVEVRCDVTVPWFPGGRILSLYYYGLGEVSVELSDTVVRGQALGRVAGPSSETGSGQKSVSLRAKHTDSYGSYIFVDLFRDTQAAESRGLWTRDNDPVCFPGP